MGTVWSLYRLISGAQYQEVGLLASMAVFMEIVQ